MFGKLLCLVGRHEWLGNPYGKYDLRRVQFCARCPEARFRMEEKGPWIKLTSVRASLWSLLELEKISDEVSRRGAFK